VNCQRHHHQHCILYIPVIPPPFPQESFKPHSIYKLNQWMQSTLSLIYRCWQRELNVQFY
jgi:hypothetical protein